jgi:SnoaL-like protein
MLHDRFVDAVHAVDGDAIRETLADDVRFFSPVVFKAYEGREVVGTILAEGAMKVFEDFSYVHRLEDAEARVATLIFKANVSGRALDGLDLLSFDEDGQIAEMKVMIRPLSGTNALAEAMGRRFEELGLTPPRS